MSVVRVGLLSFLATYVGRWTLPYNNRMNDDERPRVMHPTQMLQVTEIKTVMFHTFLIPLHTVADGSRDIHDDCPVVRA